MQHVIFARDCYTARSPFRETCSRSHPEVVKRRGLACRRSVRAESGSVRGLQRNATPCNRRHCANLRSNTHTLASSQVASNTKALSPEEGALLPLIQSRSNFPDKGVVGLLCGTPRASRHVSAVCMRHLFMHYSHFPGRLTNRRMAT